MQAQGVHRKAFKPLSSLYGLVIVCDGQLVQYSNIIG